MDEQKISISLQSDRSIEEIIKSLREAEDEFAMNFSAKEMRAVLNVMAANQHMFETLKNIAWNRLQLCCLGSCTCLTKTPEPQYHKEHCAYRNAREGLDSITDIKIQKIELEEPKFMFEIGKEYETQNGEKVFILDRTKVPGYECLVCSDGRYRYDRRNDSSDAGRCTGSPHDYSYKHNIKRSDR